MTLTLTVDNSVIKECASCHWKNGRPYVVDLPRHHHQAQEFRRICAGIRRNVRTEAPGRRHPPVLCGVGTQLVR